MRFLQSACAINLRQLKFLWASWYFQLNLSLRTLLLVVLHATYLHLCVTVCAPTLDFCSILCLQLYNKNISSYMVSLWSMLQACCMIFVDYYLCLWYFYLYISILFLFWSFTILQHTAVKFCVHCPCCLLLYVLTAGESQVDVPTFSLKHPTSAIADFLLAWLQYPAAFFGVVCPGVHFAWAFISCYCWGYCCWWCLCNCK